jgi:hypothetical protein
MSVPLSEVRDGLHALLPEAQWEADGTVVEVPPPSDDEVSAVLARVLGPARRDFSDVDAVWPEDEDEAGERQCPQRPLWLVLPPTPRRRRVAVAHGFTLPTG